MNITKMRERDERKNSKEFPHPSDTSEVFSGYFFLFALFQQIYNRKGKRVSSCKNILLFL